MKTRPINITALTAGAILLSALLGKTAQATSVLADVLGTDSGPEALPISWSVVENASLVYTYSYTVNNPAGDVLLNNGTPEVVDAYSVSFDTTAPGAYIASSQLGGLTDLNNGTAGLFWAFTPISPGASTSPLSFQSDLPPVMGNAGAQDANPPSPWSSSPNGQQVPVPGVVPEPTTLSMLLAGSGLLGVVGRRRIRTA
jgi:hypothetical protein